MFGGNGSTGGFNFGGSGAGANKFSSGSSTTTSTATTTGSSLFSSAIGTGGNASATSAPANTGFSFNSTGGNKAGGSLFGVGTTPAFQPQQAATTTASATSAPANTGFSFNNTGGNKAGGSLFGVTAPAFQPQQAATTTGFGQIPAKAVSGFSFGTPGATSAPAATTATPATGGGFSFGKTPTAPNLTLGGTGSSSTGGGLFQLGAKSLANTGTIGFGQPSQGTITPAAASNVASNPQSTATASTGFSMGIKSTSQPQGGFTLGSAALPTSTAVATSAQPTTGGITFGEKSTTITTSFMPTTSSSTGLKLGGGLNADQKATAPPTITKLKLPVSTTSAVTTSANSTSAVTLNTAAAPSLTYKDLETKVNKWTSELEQQEKLFLTQATHVNAWNKILIENAEKITKLNDEFTNVESDQKRLTQELDYIKTEQNELEEVLKPIEESIQQKTASLSGNLHTHHADLERERTYNLAENIDGQLKRMLQDLREVIDHINSSSEAVDSSNPINQVGKILSAHMDSLHWLDSSSNSLQEKVHTLSDQVERLKREEEGNFRLTFK